MKFKYIVSEKPSGSGHQVVLCCEKCGGCGGGGEVYGPTIRNFANAFDALDSVIEFIINIFLRR